MKEIRAQLADHNLTVELTDAARAWLARQGYDRQFGARPLRRALQKFVESPLSVEMLRGEFQRGDTVLVDVGPDDKLTFHKSEAPIPVELGQPAQVA